MTRGGGGGGGQTPVFKEKSIVYIAWEKANSFEGRGTAGEVGGGKPLRDPLP